jgi:non-homologous end joining protein Ku
MDMEVNAKAVLSTTFRLGTFPMPIRLYKTADDLGLSGHLFHDGCYVKIRQWKTCELHPNTEDPATFSGIQIGNKVVPLTPELKSQLFDGDTEFQALGAYRLANLPNYISEQAVVFMESYEMVPEQYFETAYSTLLDRLRVRKEFLLAVYAKSNMKRFGILLPTGIFIPIRYEEEVRSRRFMPTETDRTFARTINAELDALKADRFPVLSASSMLQRMQKWFTDVALGKTIVAYSYKIKKRQGAEIK